MIRKCDCENDSLKQLILSAHNTYRGVCPKCGIDWTQAAITGRQSATVFVTAPQAASGET